MLELYLGFMHEVKWHHHGVVILIMDWDRLRHSFLVFCRIRHFVALGNIYRSL